MLKTFSTGIIKGSLFDTFIEHITVVVILASYVMLTFLCPLIKLNFLLYYFLPLSKQHPFAMGRSTAKPALFALKDSTGEYLAHREQERTLPERGGGQLSKAKKKLHLLSEMQPSVS
ncbi:MAG: hypothetical protein ACI30I_07405 [Parabacteroides sp.]